MGRGTGSRLQVEVVSVVLFFYWRILMAITSGQEKGGIIEGGSKVGRSAPSEPSSPNTVERKENVTPIDTSNAGGKSRSHAGGRQ